MIEGMPIGDEPVVTNDPKMIFGGPSEKVKHGLDPQGQSAVRVTTSQSRAAPQGPAVQQHGPALTAGSRDVMVRSANGSPEQQGVPIDSVYGLQGEGDQPSGDAMPLWLKIGLVVGVGYLAARQLGWLK